MQHLVLQGILSQSLTRTLVFDNFNDTSGTLLTAHTPDIDVVGTGWTVHGLDTSMDIDSSGAKVEGNGILPRVNRNLIDSGESDVTVKSDSTLGTGSGYSLVGVIFRHTDTSNYWYMMGGIDSDGSSSYGWHLWEVTGGSTTNRDNRTTPTPVEGDDYALQAILSGTSISIKINETEELSYTSSSHQSATKHGIYSYASQSLSVRNKFDNFQVTSP